MEWSRIIAAIVSPIAGITIKPVADKIKRNEQVLRRLKDLNIPLAPEPDFKSVYIHALIDYDLHHARDAYPGRNDLLVEFFAHEQVQAAFQQWFSTSHQTQADFETANAEIITLTPTGDQLRRLNPDLETELNIFSTFFNEQVDLSRTAYQARLEGKIDRLGEALTTPTPAPEIITEAKNKYFKYLSHECGEITLEGMPHDQEVGSKRLRLENIFVPLFLTRIPPKQLLDTPDKHTFTPFEGDSSPPTRQPVGHILADHNRLSILADPGGGKTTLLKRLAVAYAFPERSELVQAETLPPRPWFPVFIRCRELGQTVTKPLTHIFSTVAEQVYLDPLKSDTSQLSTAFMGLLTQAISNNTLLLLIDGLDEISNEQHRSQFVTHITRFLEKNPAVSLIITSREPGFRAVAPTLLKHCAHYRISHFDNDDIIRLTLAWHKVVVGDRPAVAEEAQKLAQTICKTDRVKRLATNPLLLTTLLLVKRWVGQLPRRRSVLYGKAIEVLLMTWNVAGHEPLDDNEALPQLAFVAFVMMKDGIQRISHKRLQAILYQAREEMPEILEYTKVSVSEFVKRVEWRSSLLIQNGHDVVDGRLQPLYEFRHLTFQEYLAALAITEGHYPNRQDSDTLVSLLEPHLEDKKWEEVIPLAAILAGREVKGLIEHLVGLCETVTENKTKNLPKDYFVARLLLQCLLDEVQVAPLLLRESLEWVAREYPGSDAEMIALTKGKYGTLLAEVVEGVYLQTKTDLLRFVLTLRLVAFNKLHDLESNTIKPNWDKQIITWLNSNSLIEKASGAASIASIDSIIALKSNNLSEISKNLLPILLMESPQLQSAACLGISALGLFGHWKEREVSSILARLIMLWLETESLDVQNLSALAISYLPIIDPKLLSLPTFTPSQQGLIIAKGATDNVIAMMVPLIISFYQQVPFSGEYLIDKVQNVYKNEKLHRVQKENLAKILTALKVNK